uniref:U24 n=1 Tax=Strongyloides venezuelensis TaxID=75913 RepID=A0A0K0EYJ1_STRVS
MIKPTKDIDEEVVTTPSPKTPPDHHLSGHVNLSFEPYMFQPSSGVPFYYTPYSNVWNEDNHEEATIMEKLKYPIVIFCIVFIITIIIITYIIIDTNSVKTVKDPIE